MTLTTNSYKVPFRVTSIFLFNHIMPVIYRYCDKMLVSFAPEFQCCYFCESSCLFYLSVNFDCYVSEIMHL